MKPSRSAFLVTMLLATGFFPCLAGPITLASFDYPGQTQTVFHGINNSGKITGQVGGASAAVGFVTNAPGQAGTTFVYPGSWVTYPSGIDSAGNVVGRQITPSGTSGGFLRAADGTFTELLPGISGSAISSGGQVVLSGGKNIHVKTATGYTSFEVPSAGNSINAVNVTGVDDSLNIAGYYYSDHSTTESFFRSSDGTYHSIYIPGCLYTEAQGMNNLHQVVGFCYDGLKDYAFVWDLDGTYFIFDFPGSNYTFANGINDHGEIVGFYYDASNNAHGFLATTAPEPSTWMYFLAVGPIALSRRSVRRSFSRRVAAFSRM